MKRMLVACLVASAAVLAFTPLVARGRIDERVGLAPAAASLQPARSLESAAPCSSEKPAGALEAMLDCAGRYVTAFKRQFPSAVAEEQRMEGVVRYRQFRIRSELVLLDAAHGEGWLEFRDAFESDGRSVGGTDRHRLSALLVTPSPEALATAQRLTRASDEVITSRRRMVSELVPASTTFLARLAPFLDTPLSPLSILAADRADFRFSLAREERIGDIATRKIEYRRIDWPKGTTVGGPLRLAGTFWIHPRTGAVLRASLEAAEDGGSLAGSERLLRTVEYGPDTAGGVLVPRGMTEEHFLRVITSLGGNFDTSGHQEKATVTYINFRPLVAEQAPAR